MELENVSSGLVSHGLVDNHHGRLKESMNDLESVTELFSTLEPQLAKVSKLVVDEIRQIESKEDALAKRFWPQVDEHRKAQSKLKQLEEAHMEHSEKTKSLSDDLECISEELDQARERMDGKASSMTDATPLVEIRAAIQRLRKENQELDVRIGILDYELTQAQIYGGNPQEHSPHNSDNDSEHSFDGE